MLKYGLVFIALFSFFPFAHITAQQNDCDLQLNIGADTVLCQNQETELFSGLTDENITFQWSTGAETDTILVDETGEYILEVTADTCVYTDTIFVEVIEFPNPNLTVSEVCFGTPTQFSTTLPEGEYNLLWNFEEGETEANNAVNREFIYSQNGGSYTGFLTVTDTLGRCPDTTDFSVNVLTQPSADFSTANSCFGEAAVFLNASAGVTEEASYLLFPNETEEINLSEFSEFAYTYGAVGDFMPSLIVDNENGCRDTLQISTTVFEVPTAEFSGLESAYCFGDTATVTGVPAGGIFLESYADPVSQIEGIALFNAVTVGAEIPLTYQFTTADGCVVMQSQTTEIFALPELNVTGLDSAYCFEETLDTIAGNQNGGIFSGSITDFYSEGDNDFARIDLSITGEVIVNYEFTDGNGCFNSVTATSQISTLPAFSFPPTINLISGGSVELGYFGDTEALEFLWSNNATTPTITTENPGFFVLCVDDVNTGCTAKDTTEVVLSLYTENLYQAKTFEIYPNPVADFLVAKSNDNSTDNKIDFEIYNLLGKSMMKISYDDNTANSFHLDVSVLPTGQYILRKNNEVLIFSKGD